MHTLDALAGWHIFSAAAGMYRPLALSGPVGKNRSSYEAILRQAQSRQNWGGLGSNLQDHDTCSHKLGVELTGMLSIFLDMIRLEYG